MLVKLTCTMRLPLDQPDVNHLETLVFTAGLTLMRQACALVLTRLEQEADRTCPRCGASTVRRDGPVPGQLRTRFGTVDLTRRQERCLACRKAFRPLDPLLAQAEAARAEAQAVVASRLEVEQVARELVIALDGGWVKSREQPGGMESTVGVLATGRVTMGKTRRMLLDRRVVATRAGVEAMGALVSREAARLGVERAEKVAVLGDGAAWIDTVARDCLPGSERRLAGWYRAKRTREAVRAAKEETAEAAELERRIRALRWRGQVEEALAVVETELGGPAGEALAGYLANQRAWIGNAEDRKARGEVSATGAVVKAVDLVVTRRCKGRGMRWTRRGAEAIVALRTNFLNAA